MNNKETVLETPFDLGKIFGQITGSLAFDMVKPGPPDTYTLSKRTDIEGELPEELLKQLEDLYSRIPLATRKRLHFEVLSYEGTFWFRKGANHKNLFDKTLFPNTCLTGELEEAASILSLPCGFAEMNNSNPYTGKLTLWQFPEDADIDEHVIQIYQGYVFFHEVAHIFAKAAHHWKHYVSKFLGENLKNYSGVGYQLTLPNGRIVDGETYIEEFADLIDKYGPFGSYSKGYPKGEPESLERYLWLHENIADASAAYFMGHIMDGDLGFPPLPEEVQEYLYNFYHAEAVIDR